MTKNEEDADEYASKVTKEYCEKENITEWEDGKRTYIAQQVYNSNIRKYFYPDVDYTIKNTGKIVI